MVSNNLWHHHLLTTTAIGIGIVTVYSVIDSSAGNRPVADFVFPETVPLSSWEHIGNQKIDVPQTAPTESEESEENEQSKEVIQSANRYQYRGQNTRLDIEMHYLTDTRGNLENLLVEQNEIAPEVLKQQEIKQQDNASYYSLFSDRDRTYLSSCLHPTGDSTVTAKQFSQSLDRKKLNLKLISNWFLGKASIRDRRCLWVTISTPNDNDSFSENRAMLEEVWQNWHQWWQPRFPSL